MIKIKDVQKYVAKIAISPSSLRNSGSSGVIKAAQDYLGSMNLKPLKTVDPKKYSEWLEENTIELQNRFPPAANKWGLARKALNIFLCHSYLNWYLHKEYSLHRLRNVMETPLDSIAANRLRKENEGQKLPRWITVSGLTTEKSNKYQQVAGMVANRLGVPRACLDVVLFIPKRSIEKD
jgi:hypothetical protein